jgi:hypothetical protein
MRYSSETDSEWCYGGDKMQSKIHGGRCGMTSRMEIVRETDMVGLWSYRYGGTVE